MKILIWGTGYWAESFLLMSGIEEEQIIGYVESQKSKEVYRGKTVYASSEVKNLNFDIIIVANSYVEEIMKEIEKQGIECEKAVFLALTKIGIKKESGDIVMDKKGGTKYQYDFSEKENSKIWISFVGGNGAYSNSKGLLEQRATELDMAGYWKEKDIYEPSVEISKIAKAQRAFLERYFFPKLEGAEVICDFACASGEWSEFISPYVGHIDGFDCSEKMIASARKNAALKKIDNISYAYMDATQLHFERQYDHFIMMGLLTCIDDEGTVRNIVHAVSDSIKSGGYLVVRDTLNMSEPDKIFYNNPANGNYSAVYHAKEIYENIFEKNGFEIVQEEYFQSYCHQPIEVGSHGYIFRKK